MEDRIRAATDRFRVGTWGIRVKGGHFGTKGAWLGFGVGDKASKAQIILDEEVVACRTQICRFQTEEDAKNFLVERTLCSDGWPEVIVDLHPEVLDKKLW